ncbi:MAG: coenzyme A pyrophosphatase [Candidatus Cloacimonadota bacterium]|nr:MAG: coenzyme A pyrophosphatase [Candidatus Cloacimonadota bacterium]
MPTNEEIKNLLPGISCFIGKEDFFASSILLTFYRKKGEIFFIFQKRASGIRQGGEISFPGGGRNHSDKNGAETAVRETEEELGISRNKIILLGSLGMIFAPVGSIAEVYCAELKINSITELFPNKAEVEYCFDVPLTFFRENKPDIYEVIIKMHPYAISEGKRKILLPAKNLGINPRYRNPYGNARSKVLFYNFRGEIIWGLTAKIVHNFINLSTKQEKEKI